MFLVEMVKSRIEREVDKAVECARVAERLSVTTPAVVQQRPTVYMYMRRANGYLHNAQVLERKYLPRAMKFYEELS